LNSKLLTGSPKTHQERELVIPRHLVELLAQRCEDRSREDYVFTGPPGGPIRLDNWQRRLFDPAVRVAGLAGVSPHDLRHTAASLAVATGATVKDVSNMLGHASAAMTLDVYFHLFQEDAERLAERLDRAHEQHAAQAAVGTVWAPAEVARLDERRATR
jgi:integrase